MKRAAGRWWLAGLLICGAATVSMHYYGFSARDFASARLLLRPAPDVSLLSRHS